MLTFLAQVDISKQFAPAAKFSTLADLINLTSKLIAFGGGAMVLASFVYTAYLYLSSEGEAKNLEQAKLVLTYSIIGLVVIFTAYWVVQIIARVTGNAF